MNTKQHLPTPRAFTLIEMLVVIAVIGILAALLFPAAAAIKKTATIKRAKSEMEQIETAIDSYKQKMNFYPPDNQLMPNPRPAENPLYFELRGVVENGNDYETLDGSAKIAKTQVPTVFGRDGFANLGARKGAEEGAVAENFLKGQLSQNQVGELATGVKVLVGSPSWPNGPWQPIVPAAPNLNPWRYVSTNPTNNPKSYDLWIDLPIGGKVYRVSNWRKDAETVTVP